MASPYFTLAQLMSHIERARQVSPAAVHGLWCGRLATGSRVDIEGCWQYTLRLLSAEGSVPEPIEAAFRKMLVYVAGNLQDPGFEYELWLPEDEEESLHHRLSALAEWCRGYLEGLVSVQGDALESISEDTRELVRDLMAIGDVETEVEESEAAEKQLVELTEFVKVAAQNIQLDLLRNLRDQAVLNKAKAGDKPTLH